MGEHSFKKRDDARGQSLKNYWPLAALVLVSVSIAFALSWPAGSMTGWMHYFMGIFLCIFALLKLFHPDAFADGFSMYDVIASRFRPYAYAYPLIELGLGLGYLSFFRPAFIYGLTIMVMTIGTIGVVRALRRGLDIHCPCMGSVLDVPLSTVTLTEDVGMGLMAAAMLMMNLSA